MFGEKRKSQKIVAEYEARIQTERARADSIIQTWQRQGGEPTEELWRSIAVVHVMVVFAPKMYKPFFFSTPESHAELARLYGKVGLVGMASSPWLDRDRIWEFPAWLWKNHIFGDTYREMGLICRAMAIRSDNLLPLRDRKFR